MSEYVIKQNAKGKHNIRLDASNGKTVLSSRQGYGSVRDAKRGIRAARIASLFARVRVVKP